MPVGSHHPRHDGTNRLRRVDRWIAALPALRRTDDPLVVDLGYGAAATTASSCTSGWRRCGPMSRCVGIEIEPERVARSRLRGRARPGVDASGSAASRCRCRRPAAGGHPRLNVLRQYDEREVAGAWALMTARLQPGGVLVEGTCNEVGRVASWVDARRGRAAARSRSRCGSPGSSCRRSWPSGCRRRSSTATCRASACTTLLAELDRAWAVARPARRSTGRRSAGSRRSRGCGRRLAGARRPHALAARRADAAAGTPSRRSPERPDG